MGHRTPTAGVLAVILLASVASAEDADAPDASRTAEIHNKELWRMLTDAKKLLAAGKRDEGVRLLKEVMRLDKTEKRALWHLARYQESILAWREGRIREARLGFRAVAGLYGRGNFFLSDVTMASTEFDLPRARILLPLIVEEYPSAKSIRLLRTADEGAIKLLDTLLGDADVGVDAGKALFWVGEKGLGILRERPDAPERSAIIEQIEEHGKTERAVQELMWDSDFVRGWDNWVSKRLDRLNADRTRVSARIEELFRTHPNGKVRSSLFMIVPKLGDPSILERLIPIASKDPYDPVRWEAADRIGDLGDRKYVPLLKRMIHDPGRNVAGCSFRSLSRILGDEAIPLFNGLLKSKDRRSRAGAITALNYHYKGAKYRGKLAQIINTPGHPARYDAAMKLAWPYKDRRAVPVLLEMVKDRELPDRLRKSAINDLKWHFSIDATVEAEKD
jgi:HEAT repeat protein